RIRENWARAGHGIGKKEAKADSKHTKRSSRSSSSNFRAAVGPGEKAFGLFHQGSSCKPSACVKSTLAGVEAVMKAVAAARRTSEDRQNRGGRRYAYFYLPEWIQPAYGISAPP
uniref:Reverse transcriptase domain-containing protein n=1 Tax=Mesocestoides corti TaxID=53468 RepID=A0A5K3EXR5_MESCO